CLSLVSRPHPSLEVPRANRVPLEESHHGGARRAGAPRSNVLDEKASLVQVAELTIVDESAIHEKGGAHPFRAEDRRHDIVHLAESIVERQEQGWIGQRPAPLPAVR